MFISSSDYYIFIRFIIFLSEFLYFNLNYILCVLSRDKFLLDFAPVGRLWKFYVLDFPRKSTTVLKFMIFVQNKSYLYENAS